MNLPPQPPGTILQHMYLKERLRLLKPGKFLEVGCGQGILSKIFLHQGWKGIGYDLNSEAIEQATYLNKTAIQKRVYEVRNEDWFASDIKEKVDLIISCMVLEHFNDTDEERYFTKCKNLLKDEGKLVLFVPASPDYWGVEDEIAGHYRRYTFADMWQKLSRAGYRVDHLAGLTYPVSNLLFPLSEFLVSRAESRKKTMSLLERTKQSGYRNVLFKTNFPSLLKIILNEAVMYPFHLLQKANKNHDKALVMYVEARSK